MKVEELDLTEITFNYLGPVGQHYVPKQETFDSLGYDIQYVGEKALMIPGFQQVLVPTGLRLARPLPSHLAMTIWPRSSLFRKHSCIVTNSIGLVDGLYSDEIFVSLYNMRGVVDYIKPKERIAQLVFVPVRLPIVAVSNDGKQDAVMTRGGFGSTDG